MVWSDTCKKSLILCDSISLPPRNSTFTIRLPSLLQTDKRNGKDSFLKVRFDTIVFSCRILLNPKKFIAQHDLEFQNKTFKAIDFKMKMV